ncbi:MAG: hypothetical protein IT440_01805 [Phycisphaeraceae bacterium]|nr:hypothetical protein [Phycisphaeraceae bacterium]
MTTTCTAVMTRRENLTALLAGQTPAWTPCSINIGQWFTHHQKFGTLPPELAEAKTQLDAMKVLGCDLFSRGVDGGWRPSFEGVEQSTSTEPGTEGPRTAMIFHTPHGELRHVYEEQTRQTTSYAVEDYVKDWETDGQKFLWCMERFRCTWDDKAFLAVDEQFGDDGVVLTPIGGTPLKMLHQHFGLDGACVFVMDHPDEAKMLCDMYWRSYLPALKQIAAHPRVQAVCMMDNVDCPFYPPQLCKDYWTPYVREAVDILRPSGKRLFVHACGHLHGMLDVFREAGLDGLEGMPHPPLGDFTTDDARHMPSHFIYNGGFSASEQVLKSDDQVRAFYDRFFRELEGFDRLIFAAACQTTVTTTWQRIRMVMDLARQYRGGPVKTN